MVLVLVVGDLHIPHRSLDLPSKFKKLLVPGKISQILFTGNACTADTYAYFKSICADILPVKGDFDEYTVPNMKDHHIVSHGEFKIGLIHGHQIVPWDDHLALSIYARKFNVDILISGHTHSFHAFEHDGRLFVNPGSATGGLSPATLQNETPSFVLMDIQSQIVNLYVYKLSPEGNVQVEKVDYSKKSF